MARVYKPGQRRVTKGVYVPERMAWVDTVLGQSILMYYPEDHDVTKNTKEPGPTVKVLIPRHTGQPVLWDISSMTLEELQLMREFFDLVFDTAEPIVRMRDEVAQDEFAAGNDSITRLYRKVPQLVVRKRPEPQHSEGVLDGHENVPEGDGDGRGSGDSTSGGVRGSGSVVADGEQEGSVGQDDGEASD